MRPLLWKEVRYVRLWVLGGAALAAGLDWAYHRRISGDRLKAHICRSLCRFCSPWRPSVWVRRKSPVNAMRARWTTCASDRWPGTVVWRNSGGHPCSGAAGCGTGGFGLRQSDRDRRYRNSRHPRSGRFSVRVLTLFPRYWLVYSLTLFFSCCWTLGQSSSGPGGAGGCRDWAGQLLAEFAPFPVSSTGCRSSTAPAGWFRRRRAER